MGALVAICFAFPLIGSESSGSICEIACVTHLKLMSPFLSAEPSGILKKHL